MKFTNFISKFQFFTVYIRLLRGDICNMSKSFFKEYDKMCELQTFSALTIQDIHNILSNNALQSNQKIIEALNIVRTYYSESIKLIEESLT